MKFKATVTLEKDRTLVVMTGWLDERAELPELEEPSVGDVVVDLGAVTTVNSIGVRNWMQWQESLGAERNLILINCAPVVVKQINILDGFLNKRTKVESIFVPYFCEDCGYEEVKLLNIAEVKQSAGLSDVVESYKCPECSMNMALDMIKSQYLAFIKKEREKFNF